MIPFNAVCTCGHTLAEHHDEEDQCDAFWREGGYEGRCGCAGFVWDNGEVRD